MSACQCGDDCQCAQGSCNCENCDCGKHQESSNE
jgi:hypothetical protein